MLRPEGWRTVKGGAIGLGSKQRVGLVRGLGGFGADLGGGLYEEEHYVFGPR